MKIDTQIRDVTGPGANLFLELGFEAEETGRLRQSGWMESAAKGLTLLPASNRMRCRKG